MDLNESVNTSSNRWTWMDLRLIYVGSISVNGLPTSNRVNFEWISGLIFTSIPFPAMAVCHERWHWPPYCRVFVFATGIGDVRFLPSIVFLVYVSVWLFVFGSLCFACNECERSNANRGRSEIDLNGCEHFVKVNWESGAIHTSELDRSEIDLSPKRSECERSNANWDRSKISI